MTYTDRPKKVRVFFDPDETDGKPWNVDGTDGEGRYTEACARFATYSDACAAVPAFRARNIPAATVCRHCGNEIEQKDDPTGQRSNAWAEKSWGDDRDFQCGMNPDSNLHQPEPERHDYEVTYGINLFDMESPEDAARTALQVILGGESRCFFVKDTEGNLTQVDLTSE